MEKGRETRQGQCKNGEPVVKGNATGLTNGCLLRCLQDFVLKNAWCEASFFGRQQLQLVCSHECVPAIGLEESDSWTILSPKFFIWKNIRFFKSHLQRRVFACCHWKTVEAVAILQDKQQELGPTEAQDK